MNQPDVTLYLGLATAIATALGAAIHFELLKPRSRTWERVGVTTILCVAVLGIVSALIAVGKGRSQTPLTQLMFVGLSLPALYALSSALEGAIQRRGERYVVLGVLSACAGVLLVVSSPSVLRALVSPHDIAKERADAIAEAARFFHPGPTFECQPSESGVSLCNKAKGRVAFNMYTNTSVEGDERRFAKGLVQARYSIFQDSRYTVPSNVVEVNRNEQVRVRVYFRNGADPSEYANIAESATRDARIGVFVPTSASAGVSVLVVLYAANANPRIIADRVAFVSDEPFRLSYVPQSAVLVNQYSGETRGLGSGIGLPDLQVRDVAAIGNDPRRFSPRLGTPIGYSRLDGRLRGGFNQDGWIWLTFEVR